MRMGAEMGWFKLLCGEASSSGAAAGLRQAQLLSGPAQWEISKSFTEGLASLRPVRDNETQRRRDLPKVPLREQKPGHSWLDPVEPPQLLEGCRLVPFSSTAWQCLPSVCSIDQRDLCSPSGTCAAKELWKHPE